MRWFNAYALTVCTLVGGSFAQSSTSSLLQQLQQALPTCAVGCLVEIIPSYGCSITNTDCICQNTEMKAALTQCIFSSGCTKSDAESLEGFQHTICGDEDNTKQIRSVAWSFYAIASSAILFRFVARIIILPGSGLWWDDWTALLAFVVLTAYLAVIEVMIRRGVGRLGNSMDQKRASDILYYSWIQSFIYTTSTVVTKFSIILLYIRIFPRTSSTWFWRICHVVNGLLAAYLVAIILSLAFECMPVQSIWNSNVKGDCADGTIMILVASALNIFFDVAAIFLPIPKILQLNISVERKIGITTVLMVGLFVTACSAVRLAHLLRFEQGTANIASDFTGVLIWSAIETCVGVFCCCMPTMAGPIKLAFMKTIGKKLSSFKSSNTRSERASIVALERLPSSSSQKGFHPHVMSHTSHGNSSQEHITRDTV